MKENSTIRKVYPRCWLPGCGRLACTVLFLTLTSAAHASWPTIEFSADTIELGDYIASGVQLSASEGTVSVNVDKLTQKSDGPLKVSGILLSCSLPDGDLEPDCAAAPWSLSLATPDGASTLALSGQISSFSYSSESALVRTTVNTDGFSSQAEFKNDQGRYQAGLTWQDQEITRLPDVGIFPEQFNWIKSGSTTGHLAYKPNPGTEPELFIQIETHQLGFDSPEGLYAAEGLQMKFSAKAPSVNSVRLDWEAEISAGDLLIDNFYTSFSSPGVKASGQLQLIEDHVRLDRVRLGDGSALELEANAEFDMNDPMGSLEYTVDHFELYFPEAYERYLESIAAKYTLNGLTVTGSLLWSGRGAVGGSASGVLDVLDLTIVDSKRNRFAVTGLDAHILPQSSELGSSFSWKGLLLHQINLGAGEADVDTAPGQFSLSKPLELKVLGGDLLLETLQVKLPGQPEEELEEPEIVLYATVNKLDMQQLTRALEWPEFGGTVNARIPGVTLNSGVLAVSGTIEFDVFDGQVSLSGLSVERPFGVLPSLAANLEVSELDLQQVTSTFSFGRISGRMSGFVHDLRMLDWKPVAFDAWMGTPLSESSSKEISRKAVNHLTTIGGGSATAALTGPIMKLFNNFSYRRLGLGCHLQNNVCDVRGLDDDQESVLIMEGAGVPKIMIRAFNRSMDWPSLVGGLSAASKGEEIRVGDRN